MLNPVNTMKRTVKWGLIAHTTAMFLLLTVPAAIGLALLSNEYINNRDFPGNDTSPPGPLGIPSPNVLVVLYNLGFPLSQWLADGLLVSCIPNSVY